jgi:glutathione S-transferase
MTVELHQFPRGGWTLPNPSPFCLKVETWLRMAGVEYTVHDWSPGRAPMGKAPFVVHDGDVLADSTTALRELTRRLGVDLDEGLSVEQRAIALLAQRTLEEHTYWALMFNRWVDEAGWSTYLPIISRSMPGPLPGVIARFARRGATRSAAGHGLCRHSAEEVRRRGIADLDALDTLRGERAFLVDDHPRTVDAVAYAFVAHLAQPEWGDELSEHARSERWRGYLQRMRERYWPDGDR